MNSGDYFRLLQKPFDWDLRKEEKELAVAMAKEHGGKTILHAWHEFQREQPLRTFEEFKTWFEELQKHAAAGSGQETLDFGNPFASVYAKLGRAGRASLVAFGIFLFALAVDDAAAMPRPLFHPVSATSRTLRVDTLVAFPGPYRETIRRINTETRIPEDVLYRLIERESSWKADAVGGPNVDGSRDLGLMQLGERWIPYFAELFFSGDPEAFDPFDPEHNLEAGMRYLRRLFDATGSWIAAVQAYNCGLSRVVSGRVPESTERYSRIIAANGGEK